MAEARITSIQTSAEREAGQPARAHNQTLADLNARIDAAEARSWQRIAETRAAIAHLQRTKR